MRRCKILKINIINLFELTYLNLSTGISTCSRELMKPTYEYDTLVVFSLFS